MKKLSLFAAIMLLVPHLYTTTIAHAATNGDLVRCPDISTVYYISNDGKRYSYPNEKVYSTWHTGFNDVQNISCAELTTIPFGGVIKYRSGVRLVKLASAPETYVVTPGDVLREIPTEEIAVKFFGPDWAKKVDDLPEGFFSHYTVGAPLTADTLPPGMILKNDKGDLFRVSEQGDAQEVDDLVDTNDDEAILNNAAEDLSHVDSNIHLLVKTIKDLSPTDREALLKTLQAKPADTEVHVDVKDLHEETDSVRAQHRIDEASAHIARAEEKIAERKAHGDDVTASTALLADATSMLTLAKGNFTGSLFTEAITNAKNAQWLADQSRIGQKLDNRPMELTDDNSATDNNGTTEDVQNPDDTQETEDTEDVPNTEDSSGSGHDSQNGGVHN